MDGSPQPATGSWRARLELGFAEQSGRTVLARRRHLGPLGVQRPFHPERDGTCHVYVLHPPGGVVAGDVLELEVAVDPGARTLLTTPAATKLYRSSGARACVRQHLRVGSGAWLEWLPQETIAFDGSDASIETRVELAPGAVFAGFEILCLGRPAGGERFAHGRIEQRFEVWQGPVPLYIERARHHAGSAAMLAPHGMHGAPVVGTLLCVNAAVDDAALSRIRERLAADAPGEGAATRVAFALVCRYRGASVERAHAALRGAWTELRTAAFGKPAVAPRIWAT